jgi:hypothetical protein
MWGMLWGGTSVKCFAGSCDKCLLVAWTIFHPRPPDTTKEFLCRHKRFFLSTSTNRISYYLRGRNCTIASVKFSNLLTDCYRMGTTNLGLYLIPKFWSSNVEVSGAALNFDTNVLASDLTADGGSNAAMPVDETTHASDGHPDCLRPSSFRILNPPHAVFYLHVLAYQWR